MKKKTKGKKSSSSSFLKNQLIKKDCPLKGKNESELNYKNIKLLKKYISDSAKILPTRITGVSHSNQKKLNKEIKKARTLALLPFVGY